MRKRRRLRQEAVLLLCTLAVIICGVVLVAPTYLNNPDGEIIDTEVRQKMVATDNINDLLTLKNINIGESTKIRSLLRDKLPAGLFLSTFDITLNKLTVKYALTERSQATEESYAAFWQADNCRQILIYNTAAMFALVRNLEIIEINVDGYEHPTALTTREFADSLFGKQLSDLATAAEWQQTLITDGVYSDSCHAAFFAERPLQETESFLSIKH